MEKPEENTFISLEPYIPTPSDIQYIHLDEESTGIQPRKKWVFRGVLVVFFKLFLIFLISTPYIWISSFRLGKLLVITI